MDAIPLSLLFSFLILLIFLSAFFSSSETGMMALNRYRLKHMANAGHGPA
ncbi:MAG: CNNM domain-containing protein, partial [Gammaproteobacteria bacterium]